MVVEVWRKEPVIFPGYTPVSLETPRRTMAVRERRGFLVVRKESGPFAVRGEQDFVFPASVCNVGVGSRTPLIHRLSSAKTPGSLWIRNDKSKRAGRGTERLTISDVEESDLYVDVLYLGASG